MRERVLQLEAAKVNKLSHLMEINARAAGAAADGNGAQAVSPRAPAPSVAQSRRGIGRGPSNVSAVRLHPSFLRGS
jgi:hypothetical protein